MATQLQTWWKVSRARAAADGDRGDVPGWVLITMMTAGIVVALWIVAEPTLRNLLTNALNIAGDPSK